MSFGAKKRINLSIIVLVTLIGLCNSTSRVDTLVEAVPTPEGTDQAIGPNRLLESDFEPASAFLPRLVDRVRRQITQLMPQQQQQQLQQPLQQQSQTQSSPLGFLANLGPQLEQAGSTMRLLSSFTGQQPPSQQQAAQPGSAVSSFLSTLSSNLPSQQTQTGAASNGINPNNLMGQLGQLGQLISSSQERSQRAVQQSQEGVAQAVGQQAQTAAQSAQNAQGGIQSALQEIGAGLQRLATNNPNLMPDVKNLYQSVSSKLSSASASVAQAVNPIQASREQQLADDLRKAIAVPSS